MKLADNLKVGQMVSIELVDEQGLTIRHPSRVENITKDELYLATPMQNRTSITLPEGEKVKIRFWDIFTSYAFETKVICNTYTQIPVVVLQHPINLKRVQKREYVRVQYTLDVQVKWVNDQGECIENTCKTRDISGGGLMLMLKKRFDLKKDDTVNMKFEIDDKEIETDGKVIWNDFELDSDGIIINSLGIKFTTLIETDRKHIVQSVYHRQIQLRRKGLL
jgi:c-di-GMP-binding flagellar brake protein YcgR